MSMAFEIFIICKQDEQEPNSLIHMKLIIAVTCQYISRSQYSGPSFTTLYFKAKPTLIIRRPNLFPKCNFVYYWTFILRPPAI